MRQPEKIIADENTLNGVEHRHALHKPVCLNWPKCIM